MEKLFNTSIPASLAKRLGEAADGFRNVGNVYFVAGYSWPHKIKEFFDPNSAKQFLSSLTTGEADIFGPFNTSDEMGELNLFNVQDIESIEVKIKYNGGCVHNEVLEGNIDSIFLNLASFDKFVFPYYCKLYGADYAKTLRDTLISQYKGISEGASNNNGTKKPPSDHPHKSGTLFTHLNEYEESFH